MPPIWWNWCEHLGKDPDPYIIKIVRYLDAGYALELSFPDRLRITEVRRTTAYLHRSEPVLGGHRITTGNGSGTLGGVLVDSAGTEYGLTCAHVVGVGSHVSLQTARRRWLRRSSTTRIGRVVRRTDLVSETMRMGAPYRNTVDVGLFEIDPSVAGRRHTTDLNRVVGTIGAAEVDEQVVRITGATSGERSARVSGLGRSYWLVHNGERFLFENLVQLQHPSRYYGLLGTMDPISRPRDSGAWVTLDSHDGVRWGASLVGGDRVLSYAVLASASLDALRGDGYQLTP